LALHTASSTTVRVVIGDTHQDGLVLSNGVLDAALIEAGANNTVRVGASHLAAVLATGAFSILSPTSIELVAAVSALDSTNGLTLSANGTIDVTATLEAALFCSYFCSHLRFPLLCSWVAVPPLPRVLV